MSKFYFSGKGVTVLCDIPITLNTKIICVLLYINPTIIFLAEDCLCILSLKVQERATLETLWQHHNVHLQQMFTVFSVRWFYSVIIMWPMKGQWLLEIKFRIFYLFCIFLFCSSVHTCQCIGFFFNAHWLTYEKKSEKWKLWQFHYLHPSQRIIIIGIQDHEKKNPLQ